VEVGTDKWAVKPFEFWTLLQEITNNEENVFDL